MTEPTGPRADILNERLVHLGTRFDGFETRVEKLATKEEIMTMIGAQNQLYNQRIHDITDDIKMLMTTLANETASRVAGQEKERADRITAIEKERTDREAAQKDADAKISRARTTAFTAIGLAVSIILALITIINQLGGAPA